MRRSITPVLGLSLLLATACDPAPEGTPPAGEPFVPRQAGVPVPGAGVPGDAGPRPSLAGGPGSVEAVSLMGAPLEPIPLAPEVESRLRSQLDSARAAYEAQPGGADAIIWLGRRQAYLGRYRDAIETFSEGIELHRDDPRLYRHRGHRYITVRELERAVEDLEHAARLVSGQEDEVEPDGQPNAAGVPRSTLHTNIWYHLGLARYLQRDFEGAAHAFRWGLQISPNDDMRVAMADWLWLALKRLGRDGEAAAVLETVTGDMEILENGPYHRRLLMYKGELARDTLIPTSAGEDPDPISVVTYGYGVAAWHLVRGDRLRARTELERVLATGYWPAFGYIAAEAELAALGHAPPRADTVGAPQHFAPTGGQRP